MTERIDRLEKATIAFLCIAFCANAIALFSILMTALGF
jgi:hypothetical protein